MTVGATEAIAAAVLGLVEPGSEVDADRALLRLLLAGGGDGRRSSGRRCPLVPDGRGFALDIDALRRAVTPRTRALIVNSPHNPTGTVLERGRAGRRRRASRSATDLLVITDEVYEHLVYDEHRHLPLAAFDGHGRAHRHHLKRGQDVQLHRLEDRMGLRPGRTASPAVRAAKQYLSYVGGAPFQPAVALALDTEDAWVAELRRSLQARRDRLAAGLTDIGFEVHHSDGSYFLCADPRPLGYDDSTAFCATLPEQVGVAAIPLSAFCDPAGPHAKMWNHLVRFTFCKRDDTLDEAIRRLGALKKR